MADPTWYDASAAKTDMNISVTDKGLTAAREQCLRFVGLSIDTETPPSESFAQGVVLQALANKQASQAAGGDADLGGQANSVRVWPMDKKIQSLLIIPAPSADETDGRDHGRVRSLIG